VVMRVIVNCPTSACGGRLAFTDDSGVRGGLMTTRCPSCSTEYSLHGGMLTPVPPLLPHVA